jgi:hypothetical protein
MDWFLGFWIGAAIVLCAVVFALWRDRVYQRGFRDGNQQADTWWTGIEGEVAEARKKIWREELTKR